MRGAMSVLKLVLVWMESNEANQKKHLSCRASTSYSAVCFDSCNDKDEDDQIDIDDAECTGTEEEDEEEDEEFQPNEADLSSEDVMSVNRRMTVEQLKSAHGSNYGNRWQTDDDADSLIVLDDKQDDYNEIADEDTSTSAALHRELKNLSFRNPGFRCTLPVPLRTKRSVAISTTQGSSSVTGEPFSDRRSSRKRTAKRDEQRFNVKSKIRYNNKGRLVIPGRIEVDLCDCLDSKCNGCQYQVMTNIKLFKTEVQCKRCGSNKCSYACRINRTTLIEHIDVLGVSCAGDKGGGDKNPLGVAKKACIKGILRIPMGVEVRRERPSGVEDASIKLAVLIWLTVQNAVHALLLRYSRVRDVPDMYFSTVAVFWTEIIKLCVCLVMVCRDSNSGILGGFLLLKRQVFDQPRDTLKVCLPSMLYILQNNLFYTAASHLNAATFMIVSQLKIFSAAIFSIILLNRSLARAQWMSLCVLFVGVCFVQFQPEEHHHTKSRKHFAIEQNVLTGFTAASIACGLSGFSGVFFEKILKGSAPVSLWMRNVQMSVFAVPVSFLAAFIQDGAKIKEHGFMHGWDGVVWLTSFWYAVGGLSVAVCIKYADNIAKNFATSVAIILATLGSIHFFGFQPSLLFTLGALLVILSIFLYSSSSIFVRCFNTYGSSSSFSSLSRFSSFKAAPNSSNFLPQKQ
uniref:ARF7EP_C domain-containing protein n=1 Tax=Globodera pallida TaxID=36090 RepID=A0A183C2A0_GLOPA